MKPNALLALACFFLSFPAFTQTNNFIGLSHDEYSNDKSLRKTFSDFKVFEINSKALKKLVSVTEYLKFNLVLGDTKTFAINLTQNDIRSADYRFVFGTEKGNIVQPKPENITYLGFTDDAAQVRMTINDKFIVGYFVYKNEQYYLEPLKGLIADTPNDLFIFYRSKDILPNPNIKCGLTEVDEKTIESGKNNQKSTFRELLTQTGCLNIRLAIAFDFDLYANRYSSDATAVMNQAIAVTNNMALDYANDFNRPIIYTIVTIYVSTSAGTSLETALGTTTNSNDLLSKFRFWAYGTNMLDGGFGIVHDLGTVWIKRAFDNSSGIIGLSYKPGICLSNPYSILNGNFTTAIGYFGVLQAHEFGHNFGCEHDAANSGFIMV